MQWKKSYVYRITHAPEASHQIDFPDRGGFEIFLCNVNLIFKISVFAGRFTFAGFGTANPPEGPDEPK
jgi:hypothetical protein